MKKQISYAWGWLGVLAALVLFGCPRDSDAPATGRVTVAASGAGGEVAATYVLTPTSSAAGAAGAETAEDYDRRTAAGHAGAAGEAGLSGGLVLGGAIGGVAAGGSDARSPREIECDAYLGQQSDLCKTQLSLTKENECLGRLDAARARCLEQGRPEGADVFVGDCVAKGRAAFDGCQGDDACLRAAHSVWDTCQGCGLSVLVITSNAWRHCGGCGRSCLTTQACYDAQCQ